jgi:uncharacterized protein (DUF1810 family)
LIECARRRRNPRGDSAEQIFVGIDAQKWQSSITLFAQASPHDAAFTEVLDRYVDGQRDSTTMQLLKAEP